MFPSQASSRRCLLLLVPLLIAALASPALGREASGPGLDVAIEPGSGSFMVDGGPVHPEKRIRVHYHRPRNFEPSSPVVMVMPGAGRNGDDYRDAWVDASERFGVLVLSPSYPERFYPEYWSYNLAGMTSSVTFEVKARIDTDPDEWKLDEAATNMETALRVHPHEVFGHGSFGGLLRQMALFNTAGTIIDVDVGATGLEVNPDREDWIFGDFDRIFETARAELGFEVDGYDMFGHSAGGQILHRLALFHPGSKARRILAANSGWYTLPELDSEFPYGLRGTPTGEHGLAEALKEKGLVVFLGERDNAEETRGSLRSTPEADRQGPGRLSRGRYFFASAQEAAGKLGVNLAWELHVVPGVGHDYRGMSEAAAEYLYREHGESP